MNFKFLASLIASISCTVFTSFADENNTPFGGSEETGFTGRLYDLKTTFDNQPTELSKQGNKLVAFYDVFNDLIRKKFSKKELTSYLESEESNDLKYLIVNTIKAEEAPKEFGSAYINPSQIIMVYEGIIKKAPRGKLRFAGVFDDAMCVLVNGKLVFYVSRHEDKSRYKPDAVSNRRKKSETGGLGNIAYGKEITLKKGDKIQLVLAEVPGGGMSGKLLVQLDRFKYKLDSHEDPILHPFITQELEKEDLKKIPKSLNLNDIPVFEFKTADDLKKENEKSKSALDR